jgi:hypothetical protein
MWALFGNHMAAEPSQEIDSWLKINPRGILLRMWNNTRTMPRTHWNFNFQHARDYIS